MMKRILQDVVPPHRRSIRHIQLPLNKKTEHEVEQSGLPKKHRRTFSMRSIRWSVPIAAVLVLAGAVVGASWIFSSATVTITPKQLTVSVDTTVQSGEVLTGGLTHLVVSATSSASATVSADKEEQVMRKASGKIVVYNNYSTAPQRLIKNTRFEAPDGRIYRIDVSIIVPGQKVENGKKIPGNVEAVAYADAAGADYNLLLTDLKGDFSIPGFKGTPRYELFYARLKTDITRGFSGRAKVVDDKTFKATTEALTATLADDVWKKINEKTLPQSLILRSLYTFTYETRSEDAPSGKGVVITLTGVGKAVVFDRVLLSKAIAQKAIPDYKNEDVVIQNIADLTIVPRLSEGKTIWESSPLVLSLKGGARFVWQFDQNKLVSALSGMPKKETSAILSKFPAIERAEAVIKPFWLNAYPATRKRVHIIVKLLESGGETVK